MEFTNEAVAKNINAQFPDSVIKAEESYGMLTLEIKREDIHKVVQYMKESELNFMFLTDICGIHFPNDKEKELGVIYHLHNLVENFRIRLKVFMPMDSAVVDTLTDLYAGANWMERETFDFYGIDFKGHPDMRVILNMEELGYHPLLKQYPLEDATREDKNDSMFGR